MSRCVALTGSTGFIGHQVAAALVSEGVRVRALIRRAPPPIPATVDDSSSGSDTLPGIEWVRGDLTDRSSLHELVHGADTVIHCGAVIRDASLGAFHKVNVQGTANLAEVAKEADSVRRLLLISSLAAREPHLSWYANSKRAAEEVLRDTVKDALAWTIFRPTAVYGPGDTEMRPLWLAMRKGTFPRLGRSHGCISLLYVEDLIRAVMAWWRHPGPVKGTFELHDGAPNGYRWHQIIELGEQIWGRRIHLIPVPAALLFSVAGVNLLWARLRGSSPMFTPGKVRELRHTDWSCSNGPVTDALGWRPEVDLETAMRTDQVFRSLPTLSADG